MNLAAQLIDGGFQVSDHVLPFLPAAFDIQSDLLFLLLVYFYFEAVAFFFSEKAFVQDDRTVHIFFFALEVVASVDKLVPEALVVGYLRGNIAKDSVVHRVRKTSLQHHLELLQPGLVHCRAFDLLEECGFGPNVTQHLVMLCCVILEVWVFQTQEIRIYP
jgi:hypothetical protein